MSSAVRDCLCHSPHRPWIAWWCFIHNQDKVIWLGILSHLWRPRLFWVAGRAVCLSLCLCYRWPAGVLARQLLGTPGTGVPSTIRASHPDSSGDCHGDPDGYSERLRTRCSRNAHRYVLAKIQHSTYCPSMHTYMTSLLIHWLSPPHCSLAWSYDRSC